MAGLTEQSTHSPTNWRHPERVTFHKAERCTETSDLIFNFYCALDAIDWNSEALHDLLCGSNVSVIGGLESFVQQLTLFVFIVCRFSVPSRVVFVCSVLSSLFPS
ncbi:unnamed protein product [Polarella glacialis]|uniref:Uncharacterized protein n=1 Tax=Polarella glacialis TaxID=89957 RepID=A0A813KZF5_POLGL|nr:unnamed protein product [Polarella glacialis]